MSITAPSPAFVPGQKLQDSSGANAIVITAGGSNYVTVAGGAGTPTIGTNVGNLGIGTTLQLNADYKETVYAPAAGSSFSINLTNGTYQSLTTNANVTFTLPAASSSGGKSFTLQVNYGGVHTVTWATGGGTLRWAGGTAPTVTSVNAKSDIFTFMSDGTYWFGATVGLNY